MNDFYIDIDGAFTFGTCLYESTGAKPYESDDGSRSVLTSFKVTDLNGITAKASIFFSPDKPEVIQQFCKVNKMDAVLKSKRLTPDDCIGKNRGTCTVVEDKNPKYKKITGFMEGEINIATFSHAPAPLAKSQEADDDDDIPF